MSGLRDISHVDETVPNSQLRTIEQDNCTEPIIGTIKLSITLALRDNPALQKGIIRAWLEDHATEGMELLNITVK